MSSILVTDSWYKGIDRGCHLYWLLIVGIEVWLFSTHLHLWYDPLGPVRHLSTWTMFQTCCIHSLTIWFSVYLNSSSSKALSNSNFYWALSVLLFLFIAWERCFVSFIVQMVKRNSFDKKVIAVIWLFQMSNGASYICIDINPVRYLLQSAWFSLPKFYCMFIWI